MTPNPDPRPDQQSELLLGRLADANATPQQRIDAASALVRMGLFAEVQSQLQALGNLAPVAPEARRLLAVCRQLERWGVVNSLEDYTREKIAFEKNTVLVARRPDARKIIFVFTGNAKQVWVSIHIFNQLLPKDCHVVYLRDPHGSGFLYGLDALGLGYAQTLNGLRNLLIELEQPEILCLGSSQGGYAALRYGLDLTAKRVLVVSGRTDYSSLLTWAAENEVKAEVRNKLIPPDEPDRFLVPGDLDLAALYTLAGRRPQVTLAFGGAHRQDTAEARHMSRVPGVKLYEVRGYAGHDVLAELFASGEIRDLITWLTTA